MGQTLNLSVEPETGLTLLLCDLELALFVLSNISNSDLSAEVPKNFVFSGINRGTELVDLLL
jgi:hypothetical protein